jgi:hypothetical protein
MKPNLAALVLAGAIGLTIRVGHASNDVEAPLPPRVDFLATPASKLYLGMTAEDVDRVMGKAAKETVFVAQGANVRTLVFSGPIQSWVTLKEGRVSLVKLDAFQVDKNDLPGFSQRAWPGLASAAVRRGLGEPAEVLHHIFFGINLDQWAYSSAGADVSVFFRDDRVVGKAVGRQIPPDLFRVDLPSPPEREDSSAVPHAGMTEGEVERFNGAEKFRVDYIFNGEPVSRLVFESRAKGTFASFTLVDGVVTEFEDLGRLPDDAAFQGR